MPTPTSNYATQLAIANPNPINPGSVPGQAVLTAVAAAIPLDEAVAVTTVAGAGQKVQGARLHLAPLNAPATPVITNAGTAGGTTYTYKIVPKLGVAPQAASAGGSTTTGNASLTSTNYNIVTFTGVPYATSYDVYRTVGGGTQGKIANVLQPAALVAAFPTSVDNPATVVNVVLNDTGLGGDSSTAPTTNLTGSIQASAHNDVLVPSLVTPPSLAVGQGGTVGTTNYTYVVSAVSNVGEAPATGVQTTTGNATLTSTNYNVITWNDVPGAIAYNVYRSATSGTPNTTGLIGTVTPSGSGTYSFNDTGIAVVTAAVPTTNTTGSVLALGSVFSSGLLVSGPAPSANTTAGNATLTVANMLTNVLLRSGGTTPTDTTPTAAAIINGLRSVNALGTTQSVQAGQGWLWSVHNANSGTLTLGQAATGITWATGTTTVATVNTRIFYIQITNVTPGSEAITITSLLAAAY